MSHGTPARWSSSRAASIPSTSSALATPSTKLGHPTIRARSAMRARLPGASSAETTTKQADERGGRRAVLSRSSQAAAVRGVERTAAAWRLRLAAVG